MKNPIVELREIRGWERKKLAQVIGVGYFAITGVELGYPRTLSNRLVRAFNQAGFDGQNLRDSYRKWREVSQVD